MLLGGSAAIPRDKEVEATRRASLQGEVNGASRSILRRSLGVEDGVREAAGSRSSSKRVSFADEDHIENVYEYPMDKGVDVAMEKGSVCCQLW